MRKTKEETYQTIKQLLEIARQHFTEKGYANVAIDEIGKEAELTRGAIYHHFKNKEGLFLSVFEQVQKDIANHVEKEAMKSEDMWEQLLNGCRAFLTAASESHNHRILLIDGPAVLGWNTFRRMDQKYSMTSLKEQLQLMHNHGLISTSSIDSLTFCLSGAMNEAVLWITESPNRRQLINEVMETMESLLAGFENK
ncbi:TetR/AcrR family transcriptional regulator [Radiobacillus kanasensis]|uniref:TetR/AcrR family transcriptional regulator n=1 Tax=Radiobacillus kanasensis TaxID=2844358 RepID=UPI001E510E08|nr:TetR/AcrR family transcriptional regulator [Radiobacillus kanasensis]UFT98427.1 TetR/AcrR family transcriptional regulator [Radiobacillus kanasensis]